MTPLRAIAAFDPLAVLRDPKALMPLLGTVLILVFSVLFVVWAVWSESAGWPIPSQTLRDIVRRFFSQPFSAAMTAGIFVLTALLGLSRYGSALAKLRRESAIAENAHSKIDRPETLDEIRRRMEDRREPSAQVFFSEGAEKPAGLDRSATFAMADGIVRDGRTFRYDPVTSVVERVVHRVSNGSQELRDTQQFGIRLGILGTFLGMTSALAQVVGLVGPDQTLETSSLAIRDVVAGLSVGFGTSVAALLAALLLQILGWSLSGRESEFEEALQKLAARMQGLWREAESMGSIGTQMDGLKQALVETQRHLERQSKALGADRAAMGEAYLEAADILRHPVAALRETGETFRAVLADQHKAVEDMGRTTLSVASLQKTIANHVEGAAQRATAAQIEGVETMRRSLCEMSERLARELAEGLAASRSVTAANERLADLGALKVALERQTRMQGRLQAALLVLCVLLSLGLALAIAATAGLLPSQERGIAPAATTSRVVPQ
ncbi:hypothetical protein [Fulvimarina endophytica]|nr:hypothetical protein [Fulvimarina endophytica]